MPQDLHVEHMYPKKPHPEFELSWDNFLIACNTCNSYKNIHLGNTRRRRLELRYLWPHRENTYRAFRYYADGRVELRPGLRKPIRKAAEATREMVGLLLSPTKAVAYKMQGIAYDGLDKRAQAWRQAAGFRRIYLNRPSLGSAIAIAEGAMSMGYFSIWMEVFNDRLEVRRELIRVFKADPRCFDAHTQPVKKGRL